MTSEDTLIQVLNAVGELKAEFAGTHTEMRAGFLAVTRRLDITNGRLAKGEDWQQAHTVDHIATASENKVGAAYAAGRAFERKRAVGILQRAYRVATHPLILSTGAVALIVVGWVLGAVT